jgi:hypothetical protein
MGHNYQFNYIAAMSKARQIFALFGTITVGAGLYATNQMRIRRKKLIDNVQTDINPTISNDYIIRYPLHEPFNHLILTQNDKRHEVIIHNFSRSFEFAKQTKIKYLYDTESETIGCPMHPASIIYDLDQLYNPRRLLPIDFAKSFDDLIKVPESMSVRYSRSSDYVVMLADSPPGHNAVYNFSTNMAEYEPWNTKMAKYYPRCLLPDEFEKNDIESWWHEEVHVFEPAEDITAIRYAVEKEIYLFGSNDDDKFVIRCISADLQKMNRIVGWHILSKIFDLYKN